MNVSLPSELADFVEAKVASGRYASSGDVVREALRLLERVEQENAENSLISGRLGRTGSTVATPRNWTSRR